MTKDPMQTQVISTPRSTKEHDNTLHYNLAVNQKAVLQPMYRCRRWLEEEKNLKPEGPEMLQSIVEIESQLSPVRGSGASVVAYVFKFEEVEERLLVFYGGDNNRFLKHTWDMERVKKHEYQAIANSLLNVVSGNIGEHWQGTTRC
ncbi:hypothetical protein BGZ75_009024 [Mortierella antarctica]|nr:hypothetical protein BGZ75_009024 [Mortierella antarctica]